MTLSSQIARLSAYYFLSRRPELDSYLDKSSIAKEFKALLNSYSNEDKRICKMDGFINRFADMINEKEEKSDFSLNYFVKACNKYIPSIPNNLDILFKLSFEELPLWTSLSFKPMQLVLIKFFKEINVGSERNFCVDVLVPLREYLLGTVEETMQLMEENLNKDNSLLDLLVKQLSHLSVSHRRFIEQIKHFNPKPESFLKPFLKCSIKFQISKIIQTGKNLSIELPPLNCLARKVLPSFLVSGYPGMDRIYKLFNEILSVSKTSYFISDLEPLMLLAESLIMVIFDGESGLEEYTIYVNYWNNILKVKLSSPSEFFYFNLALKNKNWNKLYQKFDRLIIPPCQHCLDENNPYSILAYMKGGVTRDQIVEIFEQLGSSQNAIKDYLHCLQTVDAVLLKDFEDKNLTFEELDKIIPIYSIFKILYSQLFSQSGIEVLFCNYLINNFSDPSQQEQIFHNITIVKKFKIKEFCAIVDLFHQNFSVYIYTYLAEIIQLTNLGEKEITNEQLERSKLSQKSVEEVMKELNLEDKIKKPKKIKKPAAKKSNKIIVPKPEPIINIKPINKTVKELEEIEKKEINRKGKEEKKEAKGKKEKEDNLCVICLDQSRTHLTLDCGHLYYCGQCVTKLKECSICRAPVVRTLRVYK